MKKNKHLWNLAESLVSQYNSVEYLYSELINIKNALLKGNYYTQVLTVSKSGMSRTILIGYIKNNKWYRVWNTDIKKLAGVNRKDRINGCGMDMLFAAQYNLFQSLCPNYKYQDTMKRYNTL